MCGYGISTEEELRYEINDLRYTLMEQINKWIKLLDLDGKNTKKQVMEEMIETVKKLESDN